MPAAAGSAAPQGGNRPQPADRQRRRRRRGGRRGPVPVVAHRRLAVTAKSASTRNPTGPPAALSLLQSRGPVVFCVCILVQPQKETRLCRQHEDSAWHLWWPFASPVSSAWQPLDALRCRCPAPRQPSALPALGCGSAAALYLLILRPSRMPRRSRAQLTRVRSRRRTCSSPVRSSLCLYPRAIPAASLTMALALTPVVIAVCRGCHTPHRRIHSQAASGPGSPQSRDCCFFSHSPRSPIPARIFILALTPLLTGCGAVLFCSARASVLAYSRSAARSLRRARPRSRQSTSPRMSEAGLTWLASPPGFDALEALLALVALGRLSATRWSAQFAHRAVAHPCSRESPSCPSAFRRA